MVAAASVAVIGKPQPDDIHPSLADIHAAQATVKGASPTSEVKGAAFDRIIQIWLENTNFDVSTLKNSY